AAWISGGPDDIVENERYAVEWHYEDRGTGPAIARWPESITATECSEVRTDLLAPATCRSFTVTTEYDSVGNTVVVRHEAPARPQDTLEERTTWAADAAGAWWVPREMSTWSADPTAPGQLLVVERGRLVYDGGGLNDLPTVGTLTGQQVCGGLAGATL